MRWYVYAVTTVPPRRLHLRGASGEPLTLVRAGRLAAVVGRLSRLPVPTRAHLDRYHAVQMQLFDGLPVLLPARYGTWVGSPEELQRFLGWRDAALRAAVRLVRGRAQMTVRIVDGSGTAEPAAADRGMRSRRPAHAGEAGSGLAYLRGRAAAAARERSVPAFEPMRHHVQRWVRAERVERKAGVATIYHLVPRRAVDVYRRTLEDAAAHAEVPLLVTGPFPPFAFVEE